MTLTGWPLIALAAAATVAAVTVTVLTWPRGGRLRPVTRTAAVLLTESLVVVTVGLVVNRHEEFYPSWSALRGDTGTVAVAERARVGSLDAHMRSARFTWRPPGLAAWRLAGPPTVTLPHGYRERPGMAFPVVLLFDAPGRATADAVTVTLTPTAGTTAAALRSLPGELGRALRVTAIGWDVLGDSPVAAAFVAQAPAGLAVLNQPVDALPPALAAPLRLPAYAVPR
ncbi:hypothetical protein M1L60_35980 [Actinoplanes sp. TRM 88003]|uniref:Uncharacterized protein n=1 Tax=Paractinoplanes aksuensis TaxID=2939490 RepID=A0ABT1E144_9ACTN|nr:hypothetical protein [Actinoplanes aksuensis]MCO8275991.1 hypothetical protein [Actinoplanes aksuensis]